jgi:spermidine/putrescine transport system permease protein
MRRLRRATLPAFSMLVLVYLFIPIIWIVVFSFNRPAGRQNIAWNEFTFDYWKHPFGNQPLTDAFVKSLEIALVACVVATIMGALMALALARYKFRGSGLVNILLVLPITMPEIVMGASLFTFFFNRNVNLGFWTVSIAHILFCVSFVALTVKARLRGFDWTLEDASMDLGAGPLRTFSKVTFPLILPGILAALLLSFALSIDDYIITSFVAGDSLVTFPMRIYNQARTQTPPNINVLASMILAITLLLFGYAIWRGNKKAKALSA